MNSDERTALDCNRKYVRNQDSASFILNRRRFLDSTLTSIVGLINASGVMSVLGDTHIYPGNKLRLPPVWTNGEELVISPKNLTIWPGYTTSAYSINGSVPGPTIRLNRGDMFSARIVNLLENKPLVIHWHGLSVPESMDGHPACQIDSGETYTVEFPISVQRGATCWYHSHTDLLTAEQV